MGRREVPDFDRAAAFDEALAKQNPDLVTRLGGPHALAAELQPPPADGASSVAVTPPRTEPALKLLSPPSSTDEQDVRHVADERRRRGVVDRADGTQLRRLTVYVHMGLSQRLRQHCFDNELNLSEVAAEAMDLGLDLLMKGRRDQNGT
jgi:hypothetical protein